MILSSIIFCVLKFLIFLVLMVICVGVGTAIADSLMFYCEQHFNKMWLEIVVTIVPTLLWCAFSVWLIATVGMKLSNIN